MEGVSIPVRADGSQRASSIGIQTAHESRNLELDGLRGLAVSLVVIYHLDPGHMFWLWSGVDLFMVLSGFLITRVVLQSQARGTWSLRNFWMRRVLRIWPLYFIALLASVAVLLVREMWEPSVFEQVRGILLSLVFLQFTDAYVSSDPAIFDNYIPHFLHSWSVAAEEQFYIIWPLLVLGLATRRRLAVIVCIAMMIVAFLMRAKGFSYLLLLTRCDGLVLGAMLAFLLVEKTTASLAPGAARRAIIRARWIAGCLAAVGLPIALHFLARGYLVIFADKVLAVPAWYWPAVISGFALCYAAVTAAVVTNALPMLSAPLRLRPLVQIGRYSYAIYLVHPPLQLAMQPAWLGQRDVGALFGFAAYLGVLMLIGYASKTFIENPVERYKSRFPL